MLNVLYVCVIEQHDLRLVVLAGLICLFACFTAINLNSRVGEASALRRPWWMCGAAIVFGFGVWTTHFVAELAYRPGIPISYDASLTLLSALIAVAVSWVGIFVALRFSPAAGGGVIGGAVGAMHYTGILAMRAPASFHWNPYFVVASILIGMALAAAAFHVQSRGHDLRLKVISSVLLVLAIVGLHFTSMAALTLEFNPTILIPTAAVAPELLAVAVAGVTAVVITIGLAGAVADGQMAQQARSEASRLAKRVEERTAELHQVQAELLRQERLSTMGQLTGTVAHELRNPLSAVRNSLFTVRETLKARGIELDRPLDRAERNVARCDRIISDLLDYTRVRDLRCAPVEADHWIVEAVRDCKPPESIVVVCECHAGDCVVWWDAERMRRVVTNVIDNAVQAMTDGRGSGRIVVSTRVIGTEFELTITDDGPGIAAEIQPRIFEPFFSTKGFGTGLGLPAVKQIVEQHGGTVVIDSVPDDGARVTIRVPCQAIGELAA